MITFEEFHVVDQSTGYTTVCSNRNILNQHLSALSNVVVQVEKVTRSHVIEGVYGTSQNPFPPPPVKPVGTNSVDVTRTHIQPNS